MENFTDNQLIGMYLDGNRNALNGIINRYTQIIYRFVLRISNNSDEAQDITQETFIKVWKNIKKYDEDKSFKSWLFTIAQRTAIDYLRKRKSVNFSSMDNDETGTTFEETIKDDDLVSASKLIENNENIATIQKALNAISIENRTIVLLHNGEEMTFEEIAEVIGKPMNTIKSQYRRSLMKLKESIVNTENELQASARIFKV